MRARPVLAVFARAPVIGGAKTRLAAGIGKVMAWRAYRAMTAQTLKRVRDDARWRTVLAVSPDAVVSRRFGRVWPDDLTRIRQGEGDLGERQSRIFAHKGDIAVIGTDAPDITRRDIAQAFAALKRHDAVIGPAEDGGYWLLALKGPVPPSVFDAIRWSSVHTRADLEARLRRHGLGDIAHLRVLADVDEV